MIFHRLGLLHKNQRGFTLIEMVIAIAIAGIITGGITMTIFGVISGNARSTNHMVAVRQVQNAGYWVSHDAQMAQIIVTGDNPTGTGFPLTLTWTEYSMDDDGDVHQVVYTLEDSKLQRSYSVDGVPSGTTFTVEFVNPDPAMTKVEFSGGKLTLTVTATVGTGSPQEASETRTYEVIPRPGA